MSIFVCPAILGTEANDAPFSIDVGKLVGGHTALIANSGAGKTRSLRKLLEVTHGQIQHIVLDDELDFYTLRERFDYVIVGGENGDCPISVDSAEPLALALLENGLSAIIQTGAFDSADEGQAFVARFLMALLKAPRSLWHPALVVLDEAQRFAPNDGLATSSKAVAEFAASARKRGFTLVAATGRFSSLSTKVRGHVVNWLIGRAGGELDIRTAAGSLGFRSTSAEARGIPNLALGQLWAFGPALAPVPTLVQFGAVETSHLVPGQAPVPTPPAPAKLKKILAGLAAAAAASPSDTGAASRLTGQADLSQPSAAELAKAEQNGYKRGYSEAMQEGLHRIGSVSDALRNFSALVAEVEQAQVTALRGQSVSTGEPPATRVVIDPRTGQKPEDLEARDRKLRRQREHQEYATALNSAGRKMLAVLDTDPPVRRSWQQIATLAGLKARGGHFNAGRKGLADLALVVEENGLVRIVRPSTGARPEAIDPAALVEMWASTLSGAAPRILRYLHDAGEPVSKLTLSADLSLAPRGGYWNAAWKELRDNELIVESGETARLSYLFAGVEP